MTAATPDTALRAIRAKCMDCSDGKPKEVRDCPCGSWCPLYPWRFGKNPYRKPRVLSEAQREALRTRLERGRAKALQIKGEIAPEFKPVGTSDSGGEL